jgi:hypothetical protein
MGGNNVIGVGAEVHPVKIFLAVTVYAPGGTSRNIPVSDPVVFVLGTPFKRSS